MSLYNIFKFKGFIADDFKSAMVVINKHQVNILKHTWLTRMLSDLLSLVLTAVANYKKILKWFFFEIIEESILKRVGLTYKRIFIIAILLIAISLAMLFYKIGQIVMR
mgnify:CR=1 FL=1|tara:strand:- start:428 stop:751 length:324 start_codon:yes stop_codon:yes gene_type:complete